MARLTIDLRCEHVSASHVHCNRYKTVRIDMDETPREAIARSAWELADGDLRCPDHR